MLVQRAYQTELNLNDQQVTACRQHAGAARWAYNWGLRVKQKQYRATKKSPTAYYSAYSNSEYQSTDGWTERPGQEKQHTRNRRYPVSTHSTGVQQNVHGQRNQGRATEPLQRTSEDQRRELLMTHCAVASSVVRPCAIAGKATFTTLESIILINGPASRPTSTSGGSRGLGDEAVRGTTVTGVSIRILLPF
jgi:hypothetical protein